MSWALQKGRLSKLPNGLLDLLSRTSAASSTSSSPLARCCQQRKISIARLESERDNRQRVVILGSGWAGYSLSRSLDTKKYQVVVVSPRSYFVFTPLLASTSVGTLEFRTALEPVRSRRSKVEFFQGWADEVDFGKREVTIEEAVENDRQGVAPVEDRRQGLSEDDVREQKTAKSKQGQLFSMKYDKLVVSVGCYSQTFGTPGVKEHALFLKDVGDARKIRNRLLACFEMAALPTTSDTTKKNLLNFAVVGGGPTGIEFSAELHDIIMEDLAKLYPDLIKNYHITVYDVAPTVLNMFDQKLSKYATDRFRREGISIKTSHHVESLRTGTPGGEEGHESNCLTLKIKEEGDVGVGMVVWSTGLMMNPFVEKALGGASSLPARGTKFNKFTPAEVQIAQWTVRKDEKTAGIITDDRLRITLQPKDGDAEHKQQAVLEDVFAIGDCAVMEDTLYPATAQVASQKAEWLAKRLNKGDIENAGFNYKDLGVMAYVGNWNAIMQSGGASISGRTAWLVWRGAYLTKSVSWRNRILIPVYWVINWAFGRDISRF